MRRFGSLIAWLLLLVGCASGGGQEDGPQPLGVEVRPRVALTQNVARTGRGFELEDGSGPASPWTDGFARAGTVNFRVVELESPVEHLELLLAADRPEGAAVLLRVRGSLDHQVWTDWVQVGESGLVQLPARSKYIEGELLLGGVTAWPVVRDMAIVALPSAVTTTVRVESAQGEGEPLRGATVEVVELGLVATADQDGQVRIVLPLGSSAPEEAIYTFEVASGRSPYRTAVRQRITPYAERLVIKHDGVRDSYKDDSLETRGSAVDLLLRRLAALSPEEALSQRDGWDVPNLAVACEGAPADRSGEVHLLACQWGPGFNAMFDGRYLFWAGEGGSWQAQPYPEKAVRGVGYFRELRQEGDYLVVVMNVSGGMTRSTEEVQLLRRTAGWRVAWLPPEQVDSGSYTEIRLEGDGIDRFTAIRWPQEEGAPVYQERWQRNGDQYLLLESAEVDPDAL